MKRRKALSVSNWTQTNSLFAKLKSNLLESEFVPVLPESNPNPTDSELKSNHGTESSYSHALAFPDLLQFHLNEN